MKEEPSENHTDSTPPSSEVEGLTTPSSTGRAGLHHVPNSWNTVPHVRSWRTVPARLLCILGCVVILAGWLVDRQLDRRAWIRCDPGGAEQENVSSPGDDGDIVVLLDSLASQRAMDEQKIVNRIPYDLLEYPRAKEEEQGGSNHHHEKMMYNGVEILLPIADCVPALLYGLDSFYIPQEWSNLLVMRTTTCVCDRGVANFTMFPFADDDDAYLDTFIEWYAETREPLPLDGKVVCGPKPRLGDFGERRRASRALDTAASIGT